MYTITGTFSVEIKKAPLEITGISIFGSEEVQVLEAEDVTKVYTLQIKDQYGDIVTPGGSITWSLTNNLPGVELTSSDNAQAEITIAAGTLEHTFSLRAMAENGVYGEIGVVLTLEEIEEPDPTEPILSEPEIHNQVDVELGTHDIVVPITAKNGTLSIADKDKIEVASSDFVSYSSALQGDNLVITILVDRYEAEYHISILPGAISNSGVLNTQGLDILFSTEADPEKPQDTGLLYVLTRGTSDTGFRYDVHTFDTENMVSVKSQLAPYSIKDMALTSGLGSERYIYIAYDSGGVTRLQKRDAKSLTLLKEVIVPDPLSCVVADLDYVYVSSYNSLDNIQKYDAETLEFVSGSGNLGVINNRGMHSSGDFLYARTNTEPNGTRIRQISKATLQEVSGFDIPSRNLSAMTIDNDYIYIGYFAGSEYGVNVLTKSNISNVRTWNLDYNASRMIADESGLYVSGGMNMKITRYYGSDMSQLIEQDLPFTIGPLILDSEFLYVGSSSVPGSIAKLRKSDLEILEVSGSHDFSIVSLRW